MPPPAVPPGYLVEPLDKALHDRVSFSCGTDALDRFIKEQASQDQAKNLSQTHVLVPAAPRTNAATIAGYVSLNASSLFVGELPAAEQKVTRMKSIPALLIGRMAVDINFRNLGLGKCLLMHALFTGATLASQVGCRLVIVDAKDGTAKTFYERFGFVALPDKPMTLLLHIATVKSLFT